MSQTALHQYLNCCHHPAEVEPQKKPFPALAIATELVPDSAIGSEPALVTELVPGLEMGLRLATVMEIGLALDLVSSAERSFLRCSWFRRPKEIPLSNQWIQLKTQTIPNWQWKRCPLALQEQWSTALSVQMA